MGYIKTDSSKVGTKVAVEIRGKKWDAEIVKTPFVPTRYYQLK